MSFREIVRRIATAILVGLINVFNSDRDSGQEPGMAPGKPPDPDGMKPERVQFWEEIIDGAWRKEGSGVALHRTILCDDAAAANSLAARVDDSFIACGGYRPDAVEVFGSVLTVRLTTPTVGRVTEQDYVAALLVDTCV